MNNSLSKLGNPTEVCLGGNSPGNFSVCNSALDSARRQSLQLLEPPQHAASPLRLKTKISLPHLTGKRYINTKQNYYK
ncbi:hypothetical protein A6S26_15790 [Nostoc sp. ATCC 43529]|nr:hypothetical protein A6S26_15790 [Nostoc sp. ATCC 43529]